MKPLRFLLGTFILLANLPIAAQVLTLSNSVVLTNSTRLTVKGDILLTQDGCFFNYDTIDCSGDWINNNFFVQGFYFSTAGNTVILNGINQTISGSLSTSFHYLTFFNGIKTLDVLTEANFLDLNDAVLDLNSNVLKISYPLSSAIANTSGYILSESIDFSSQVWLYNPYSGIGYTIPFGNALGLAAPFKAIPSGASTFGSVSVSTYGTAANNTPYPTAPVPVTHVRNAMGVDNSANTVDRFWYVKLTSIPPVEITYGYPSAENAANGNTNMRAQKWNAATQGWDAALPGQTNPTAQSVTVPSVSIGNHIWALAQQSSPLPVELLGFTAVAIDNKKVQCNWSTASEINNDYFTVLRSNNGIDFEPLDKVTGNGTTNVQHSYTFTDNKPLQGISYYQLKQTDFNGDYSMSQTVMVSLNNEDQFTIYPNPGSGIFYLQYDATKYLNKKYVITDAASRVLLEGYITNTSGLQEIQLNVPRGIYFLKITDNNSVQPVKLAVSR